MASPGGQRWLRCTAARWGRPASNLERANEASLCDFLPCSSATNDVVVGDGHVKVAVGRDYADVSPTRGSFRGNAAQQLTVSVEVYKVE